MIYNYRLLVEFHQLVISGLEADETQVTWSIGPMVRVWCLTPLSTRFQLYCGCQFYWWRKSEYPEKTTDLSQVTDQLYYIMLYRVHLTMCGIRTRNISLVIGTDCIGSCKSNYHTIRATTAPTTLQCILMLRNCHFFAYRP